MNQVHNGQPSAGPAEAKQESADQNLELLLSLPDTKQNMTMAQLDYWLTPKHQFDTTLLNAAYQNMLEVLRQRRQLLSEEHAWTLWAVCSYCKVTIELGKLQETELLLKRGALAEGKTREELYAKAEKKATKTIEKLQKASGEDPPDTVLATWKLSKLYARQQKWPEAVEACAEALRKGDLRSKRTYPLCAKIASDLQDLKTMLTPDSPHALPRGGTDVSPTQVFRPSLKLFSRRSFRQGYTGTW